jgi:flavin-dependent dehydrogenase
LADKYDVVIIGGGPSGAAAAINLVEAGLSVAILERSQYGAFRVGETLPPAVKHFLARLGVWEQFLRNSPASSSAIYSSWESNELYEQDHIFNPYGAGWHIDRAQFDSMLASMARQLGSRLVTGARVVYCRKDEAGIWEIGAQLDNVLHRFHANYLVDATGRAATIARRFGARKLTYDRLVAIVKLFALPQVSGLCEPFTLIEAGANGWWYSAPLPQGCLLLSYMTDSDLNQNGTRHSETYWEDQLQQTSHTRERARARGRNLSQATFSANSCRLDRIYGSNWLAIGDAAAATDPLAGKGVCQSLETGIGGAHAILEQISGNNFAFENYSKSIARRFGEYLNRRKSYYERQERWPESIFWNRRQERFPMDNMRSSSAG